MPMSICRGALSLAGTVLVILSSLAASHALERAGSSAAVRGQVARANDEHPVGVQLASGEPIFLADRITSGADSGMQIMLLDQTTFTIGPDSFVKIDEFVYDPSTNAGKLTASLGKGVFRFVTGKIAATNPSSMTVKLPVATIGIRGTMVYGRSDENRAVVALAGPGPDNNTHDKVAGIDVSTPQGTVEIRRPGWGALIERGKLPVAQPIPAATLDDIIDSVAPRQVVEQLQVPGATTQAALTGRQSTAGGGAGGGTSMTSANESAGQSDATALPGIQTFDVVQNLRQPIDQLAGNAGQTGSSSPSFDAGALNGGLQSFIPGLNGFNFTSLTTFGELTSVASGTGNFSQSNVPIFNLAGFTGSGTPPVIGHYNFFLSINFGTQTANFDFDSINITGGGIRVASGSVNPSPVSYTGQIGSSPALFTSANACGNANCQAFMIFNTAAGTPAKTVLHELAVTLPGQSTFAAVGAGVVSR